MKLAAATLATLLFATMAQALDAPPGATACSGCHAASNGAEGAPPRLVGMKAADIETAMREFRSGARPATLMDRIAKGFTEPETAAIANWYAAQPN